MLLNGKPYKSIDTMDNIIVSEGMTVSFGTANSEIIMGEVVSIKSTTITIRREGSINTENWDFSDIEEGTVKVL